MSGAPNSGTMQCKKLFAFIVLALFLDRDVFSQTPGQEDFPFLMYVTARDGLRVRRAASPSLDSEIVGALPYGEFVRVTGRQDNPVTIDGTTDYWYRVTGGRDPENHPHDWVFGGFLSRELPDDLPVVIGMWIVSENNRMYIEFTVDHRFSIGRRETGHAIRGTWSIQGNTVTLLVSTFPHQTEWDRDPGEEVIETVYVRLDVADRNNIGLVFAQEIAELRNVTLTRSRQGY
ncbi:MAG: SH3 domain-containing protein [Treponema sp.]|nr:SH3 domain-containing protein [Treponema sp.]